MSRFVKLVPNMKYLSDPDRLIYMLSCEGESGQSFSVGSFICAEI